MPPKVFLPIDVKDFDEIKDKLIVGGDCTHPAGHCYGSDGGSGIPKELKVPEGQGGSAKVWELDMSKENIISKSNYIICQYCGKFLKENEKEAE